MPYEYWIGMFLPADSNVPDGFASLDFEAGTLGSCWLKDPEDEIYANENLAVESFNAEGFEMIPDCSGISSLIERYGCPRFTTPDENGDVILDICSFIK